MILRETFINIAIAIRTTMKILHGTKIGENRGKKRIWLEFSYLELSGFTPGMHIEVSTTNSMIEIVRIEEQTATSRKVSKRGQKPLIEISEKDIPFGENVEKLRLVFTQGKVVITAHHCYKVISDQLKRLYGKLINGDKLDVISLYSGGGVFCKAVHKGLSRLGIKSRSKLSVERERKYIQSSLRNNAELYDDESIVINASIEDINFEKSGCLGDLGIVSIPCTGASIAGKTKNKIKRAEEHEDAGGTFFWALKTLLKVRTPIILMECVKQYLTTASMDVIRSVLHSSGYTLDETVLSGANFGALEDRERMIVVATILPLSEHFQNTPLETNTCNAVVSDILDDIGDDDPSWKAYQYLIDKEKRDIAAGKGFRRVTLKGNETKIPNIGRGYAKRRSNEPFICHPEYDVNQLTRLMTVGEHARAKTIPESVVDGNGITVAHEILGQSGIFKKIESVAVRIGKTIQAYADSIDSQTQTANQA